MGQKLIWQHLKKTVSPIHSFIAAVMQQIAFEEPFFPRFEHKTDDGNTFDTLNFILNDWFDKTDSVMTF